MARTKFYDTKIKLQRRSEVSENGNTEYKPIYYRFLIQADKAENAREKAISIFTAEALKEDVKNVNINIIKCNAMHLDAVI